MALNSLEIFKNLFFKHAAMFKKNFVAVQSQFGESWDADFGAHWRSYLEMMRAPIAMLLRVT